MKSNIKCLVVLMLFFSACKKSDVSQPLVQPLADGSLPSGAISSAQVVSNTGDKLTVALDIYVFRDSKNIENQLTAENFLNDTTSAFTFVLQSVNLSNGTSANPYSALMLMDQSGSISGTDPKNYRINAADSFCANLGTGDNVMLWSFASGSPYNIQNLVSYGSGFSSDGYSVISYIESLRNKTGGGTPLYKSQNSVVDYCAANGSSANKAIMTFTDGENTDGGSIDDVINNAKAKQVKLYNIGLGSAQVAALCQQAFATGGAFMFAKDAPQLISMFGNLGKLLDQGGSYYHTTWTVTKVSGIFTSGVLNENVRIQLPFGGEMQVPFSIKY